LTNGELLLGSNSNYQNTTIAISSGATLDMRGLTNLEVGSITGAGTIKNFSATAGGTLVTGSDNTSGTFTGTLSSDYTSGFLNITKIGAGTWTLGGLNASQILGTLTVSNGEVLLGGTNALTDTGTLGFTTYILNPGGNLTLDNGTAAVSGRLGVNGFAAGGSTGVGDAYSGSARVLTIQGGSFVINGYNGTAVSETVSSITDQTGGGIITINAAGTSGVNLALLSGTPFIAENATGTRAWRRGPMWHSSASLMWLR
jgi:hypothetical protein